MRSVSGWVGIVVAVVCSIVGVARVEADADKRRQLRDEIERLLSDIASELRDVPGDSSTSDLDRTIDYAGRVYDKARDLRDHVDGDSDANRIASNYPDIARRYQEYARVLRSLKNGYRALDDWPKKCETAQRALADRLRAFTDSHDPRGIDEVPKLAREHGRTGKDALEAADRGRDELYRYNDKVDDFSDSDGRWSDVRSNLIAAGRTMYEYAARQAEQIKRAEVCGDLAKEDRNPAIERAMAKLLDGKKGIEVLYEAIDRQLGDIASRLDGLVGDSDDADIGAAERGLDDIDRALDQLDRIKGNDAEARRRFELGRNAVRAARPALAQLRTLKQSQYRVDKAPGRCKETEEKLAQLIRDYVGKRDPHNIPELAMRARGFGESLKDALAKADEAHRDMERAAAEVQRFDVSEGRWRGATEKLRSQAQAIFEYWKKAREAAHVACDELAKSDEHRDVKRAIADLSRSRSDNQAELERVRYEQGRWYDGVKELREWYKQDTRNVRDAFCSLAESPGDIYEGDAYIATLDAIVDRMVARLAPKWTELTRTSTQLIERLKKLQAEQDPDVNRAATKLREATEDTEKRMFAIMSKELDGRRDAEVRTFIEVGKNEHKRIQADSSKCEVSEITIPGESMRLDCVRVSSGTCYIVEIKPNNSAAEAKGRARLQDYVRAVSSLFDSNKDRIDSVFTDRLSIFKRCISNGRIDLKPELRVYDFCPADGKLFNDFVLP